MVQVNRQKKPKAIKYFLTALPVFATLFKACTQISEYSWIIVPMFLSAE